MSEENRHTDSTDRVVHPRVKEVTGLAVVDGFLLVQWVESDDGTTHELPIPNHEVSKALTWLMEIWHEHGGKGGALDRRRAQR